METLFNICPSQLVDSLSWTIWWRKRYALVLLVFFGYFNLYSLRYNLSIAIIPITEYKNHTNNNNNYLLCGGHGNNYHTGCSTEWTTLERGVVLSGFFCGYAITQLFGGHIANIFGASNVFVFGVLMTLCGSIFTPILADFDKISTIFTIRILQGLCEGCTNIGLNKIWGRWAPKFDRNRLVLISISGKNAGIIVGLFGSGLLVAKIGWQSTFYVFGYVAYIWFITWIIIYHDPHYFLSTTSTSTTSILSNDHCCECSYDGTDLNVIRSSYEETESFKLAPVEFTRDVQDLWYDILTSTSIWAILVANFAQSWGFYTLLTHYPIFLKDMFGFSYEAIGFLSALPFLILELFTSFSEYLANWIEEKCYLDKLKIRQYFTCYSFIGQAFLLILGAIIMESFWTTILITISVSLGVFSNSGFAINHMDIAPQHATTILKFSNTFATFAGVITPILTGYIIENNTIFDWQMVFYIAAGMYLCAAIFFACFVSIEELEWAKIAECEPQEIELPKLTRKRCK